MCEKHFIFKILIQIVSKTKYSNEIDFYVLFSMLVVNWGYTIFGEIGWIFNK